jgi:hypothetical protein
MQLVPRGGYDELFKHRNDPVIMPLALAPESLLVNAIECIGQPDGEKLVELVMQGVLKEQRQQRRPQQQQQQQQQELKVTSSTHRKLFSSVRKLKKDEERSERA